MTQHGMLTLRLHNNEAGGSWQMHCDALKDNCISVQSVW